MLGTKFWGSGSERDSHKCHAPHILEGSQLQIHSTSHNNGRRGDTYSRKEMKDVLSITFKIW